MLADIIAAALHGAGLVYHELLSVEDDVTKWEAANPAVKPFIDMAVNAAVGALAGCGLPVPALITAGDAVLSALKQLAAADPTVQSGAFPAVPAAAS